MRKSRVFRLAAPALVLAFASVLSFADAAAASTPAAAGSRQVITSADQLPRREIKLDKLPSEYLDAPREEVLALAAVLEKNLREDLDRFDIQDAATMRDYIGSLLTLTRVRGDWAAVPALVERQKALQDKPGPRATIGTIPAILAEQQAGGHDASWVREEVRRRYGAMDWRDVGDDVKSLKGQLELFNPAVVKGAFQQQLDVSARNMNLSVPERMAMSIIGARIQNESIAPVRDAIVAGLQAVIDAQADAAPKPDLWTPRQFAIAPTAAAHEVGVGIWDSGVDLDLFKTTPARGIAFDREMRPSKDLLRPLGEAQAKWPELKQRVKGSMDLRAALDTEDARRLKQVVS